MSSTEFLKPNQMGRVAIHHLAEAFMEVARDDLPKEYPLDDVDHTSALLCHVMAYREKT